MKLSSPLLRVAFESKIGRETCLSAKARCYRPKTRWPWRHLFLHLPHPPPHWQRASLGALLEHLHAKLDMLQAELSSAKGNMWSALRQLGWPGWRKREGGTNKSGIVVCPALTWSPEHLTIMNFSWQCELEALMTAAKGKFVPWIPYCRELLVWIIRAAAICTGAVTWLLNVKMDQL